MAGTTLPCLSVRQPWAWCITLGFKDIENRSWSTPFRGRCLIHAGKTMTRAEYAAGAEALALAGPAGAVLPPFEALQRGGIVGSVEIIDCVDDSDSPWYTGEYGFVLRNPQVLPFVPWRGFLGFFNVPASELPAQGVAA